MPRLPDNWPDGVLPRGLDLHQAAYYVGLSPNTFLNHVRQGIHPHPLEIGRRKIWDREALDAAMDRLSGLATCQFWDEFEEAQAVSAMTGRRSGRSRVRNESEKSSREEAAPPISLEDLKEWAAAIEERFARNAAIDNDTIAIERILAAHRAGETSREIGAREGLTGQKVAAIVKAQSRKEKPRR